MSLSFPTNPTVGQVYQGWVWNGQAWTTNSGFASNSVVLGIKVFTANGTYIPNPAMVACMIECVGGGAGGNAIAGVANAIYAAPGGGSGAYARKYATATQIGASQTVTVGAGGVGQVAGGAGPTNGGDTSVGSLCVAKGGLVSASGWTGGPGGPQTGCVGDFTCGGNPGGSGWGAATTTTGVASSGVGAGSYFGGGGTAQLANSGQAFNGLNGIAAGAAGAGSVANNVVYSPTGGFGVAGMVVVTEFGSGQGPAGPPGPAGPATVPASGLLSIVGASPSNNLQFLPYRGDVLKINGTVYHIPASGIVGLGSTNVYVNGVAGQNLAFNTLYRVYAFNNAGVLTADFSTTAHATSTTAGNVGTEIKSGDDTRSLIGLALTAGNAPVFYDTQQFRYTRTWFNRSPVPFLSSASGSTGSTASTPVVAATVACWAGENAYLAASGYGTLSAAGNVYSLTGLDGAGIGGQGITTVAAGGATALIGVGTTANLSEGQHAFQALVAVNTGSVSYNLVVTGNVF